LTPSIVIDPSKRKRGKILENNSKKAFDLKKIKFIVESDSDFGNLEEEEQVLNHDEYVELNEINEKDVNQNKNTFRTHKQEHERRFSRIRLGSEKSLAKDKGLIIKWGVNMG